ncbi:MAG: RDD family protein [Solirubrobacterales bacterium]
MDTSPTDPLMPEPDAGRERAPAGPERPEPWTGRQPDAAAEGQEVVEAELVRPVEERGPLDSLLIATGRAIEPFARLGWRGARGVGRRLGVNRAVEQTADRALDRALDSETVERATERVLESEVADRVWQQVLESRQAQQLVERVAEAPEVRSAITSQGVGLLEDLRRSAREAARTLDDGLDRFARRLFRKPQRRERPIYAGGATRLLALVLDLAILNGILLAISALLSALINNVFDVGDGAKAVTIAFGLLAWLIAGAIYLAVFWSFAERTPGMTFFGLRIFDEVDGRVPPGQDLKRLIGFFLAAIPFGLGFLGVLTDDRRRGWQDRFARTVVLYADPDIDPGVDETGHVERRR